MRISEPSFTDSGIDATGEHDIRLGRGSMGTPAHRPFPCPSLRVREGCSSDSHGRGTTTSPMGIRYPIPIRRGGLEGFRPSISAEPSGQGRGAATDDAQQSRPLGGLRRSPAGHVLSAAKV